MGTSAEVADTGSIDAASASMSAGNLPETALKLARVFSAGGRLVVTAPDRSDHARHVAVEFVHPAITGARSLPAFAVVPAELASMVSPADAVLIIESDEHPFSHGVPRCAQLITAGQGQRGSELVRWYHVLWELVQLGLEHPGLTGGAASHGGDSTNFLYPFLDATEHDEPALLSAMTSSAAAKQSESNQLSASTLAANDAPLHAIAHAIRRSHASGGTVLALGNGGSSCDAARLVRLLRRCDIRARSLSEDAAILTALANDLGAGHVFARQAEAALRPDDVMVLFSTSGASANLLAALDVKAASDATIVACAGYDGGPLAAHQAVDHALIVDSTSVHRIQEAQGVLIDEICTRVTALKGQP